MSHESVKPVVFSTGKSIPWWQRPPVVSMIVAAAAALAFGLWAYSSSEPTTRAGASISNGDASLDAVQKTLRAGKPTIIEFGANSCVSCREMKPILHGLAQDPRIAVADVDIIKERDYISRYQIRLMPTQVFYDASGNETSRHMGTISGDEILERLGLKGAADSAAPKARL